MEDLIIKYLTGGITDEELKSLSEWLTIENNKITFKELVKVNQKLDATFINSNTETQYIQLEKELFNKKSVKIRKLSIYKYAAAVIILLGLSFGIRSLLVNQDHLFSKTPFTNITLQLANEKLLEISPNHNQDIFNNKGEMIGHIKNDTLFYSNSNSATEKHTLTIPNGKIFNVVLSDKSNVTLNSGSQLIYQTNFKNISSREVSLTGEGFFSVTKNKKQPFIVNADSIKVHVLGTRFNVSNYENEKSTSVVLEEGSVKIETINQSLCYLKPGELFLLNKGKVEKEETIVDDHLVWINRVLFFRNKTFSNIVKKLERYYNVSIDIESPVLNDNKYTGTFTTEVISEVLDVFKELSEFNYEIIDDAITITEVKN